MLPRFLNRHALVAATATASLLFLAARPAPERARVGGTFTMTYTQRHPLSIVDTEGHVLIATEAKGRNRSTGPGSYMDGAEVRNSEIADLVQGNGPHQGYVTLRKGGEEHVSKWSGKVTTTLGADQKPVTTFEGTWTKVKGPIGQGTYRGRLTGGDAYTVDWEGQVELAPRATR